MSNRSKVKFWHDVWCGDSALKENYPQVYDLARMKEASIANLLISSNGIPQQNVKFLTEAQDWEIDVFLVFFAIMYSTHLSRGGVEDDFLVPL